MIGRRKQLPTVEEVRTCLEEWRRSRQKGTAIPDELWSAAAAVARKDGVTRTATALGLEGGKLKRLMMVADGVTKSAAAPSFVELFAPAAGGQAQCAIELQGRRGRIRIELKAKATDLASFSRTLGELVL